MIKKIYNDYHKMEKPVLLAIVTEFFIQLVNATFMNIQPLFMSKENYSDEQIAGFISFRFLGVFLLAIPLGIFIKGKKMKKYFLLSSILVPVFAFFIVYFVKQHDITMIYFSQFLWGASFTFMQIPIIPFILRNSSIPNHTAGIALSYSTWSFAGIFSGIIIAILEWANPILFNEQTVLILFSAMGLLGIWVASKINLEEKTEENRKIRRSHNYDWKLIFKALIPTLIIATGAGLTIPFISLFFEKVHHLSMGGFSIISSIAAVLVAWGALAVPIIKRTIGYKIAIPTTQAFAVISLVALATTQYYAHVSIALVIAIICYLLRQPLMNMAGPMTSEIVMNYVGKKNQEIVSALTSAIWSGSWFLSGLMVKIMFGEGLKFVNIFLITSAMYAIGVIWYYVLILDYNKREEQGLIEK